MVGARFVGTAVLGLACLAACGEDSPDGATTPTGAASTTAVGIIEFGFDPADLQVAVADTVTWTNSDTFAHTVTADDGSFDSEDIDTDATFEHTFAEAGTFTYFCNIHNYMKATVVAGPLG